MAVDEWAYLKPQNHYLRKVTDSLFAHVTALDARISRQDSIIKKQETVIEKYVKIEMLYDQQRKNFESVIGSQSRQIKGLRATNLIGKVVSGLAIGAVVFFAIK